MDSFRGTWKKILQVDETEYTPTSSAIGHGVHELSDTEGIRKMADSEINKIPPDTMGYNYYKFIDKDTPDDLILYVRTKKKFDDTAKAFGWTSNFEEFIRLLLFRSFAVNIRLCLDEQRFW